MKTVYLASKMLTHYDRAADICLLRGVTVTNQCYNALKANGYILSMDERRKLAERWNVVLEKNPSYDRMSGFTYKEVRKFLGRSLFTAANVRAL